MQFVLHHFHYLNILKLLLIWKIIEKKMVYYWICNYFTRCWRMVRGNNVYLLWSLQWRRNCRLMEYNILSDGCFLFTACLWRMMLWKCIYRFLMLSKWAFFDCEVVSCCILMVGDQGFGKFFSAHIVDLKIYFTLRGCWISFAKQHLIWERGRSWN